MHLNVYLSGEIHTDWRDRIAPGLQRQNLPMGMEVRFEDLDIQTSKKLKTYVKNRLAELEV